MLNPKRWLVIAGIMVLIIGCGAPQENAPAKKAGPKFDPYARLTETEVKQFIKAYPIFLEEAKRYGKSLEKYGGAKNPGAYMALYTEIGGVSKKIDATLRAKTGMGIKGLFTAYAKISYAYAAMSFKKGTVQYDKIMKEIEAKMNNPNIPPAQKKAFAEQLKKSKQMMVNADTMFQNVPDENIKIVEKYREQLAAVLKGND